MKLSLLPCTLAIVRLSASHHIPNWATEKSDFFSITKTKDELSVVCSEDMVPDGFKAEKRWKCLKVEGPLDFELTGILSSLAAPLAAAKIGIFVISTFDTDYLLVKKESLQRAIEVLSSFCTILS